MSILAFIVDHWSQIGLAVSELMGVLGAGGVLKQIIATIWKK